MNRKTVALGGAVIAALAIGGGTAAALTSEPVETLVATAEPTTEPTPTQEPTVTPEPEPTTEPTPEPTPEETTPVEEPVATEPPAEEPVEEAPPAPAPEPEPLTPEQQFVADVRMGVDLGSFTGDDAALLSIGYQVCEYTATHTGESWSRGEMTQIWKSAGIAGLGIDMYAQQYLC